MQHIRPAIMMIVVMTLITGLLYPLGFTALATAVFPHQSGGSLVEKNGVVLGYVQRGGGLTTLDVIGAGHLAVRDQPKILDQVVAFMKSSRR